MPLSNSGSESGITPSTSAASTAPAASNGAAATAAPTGGTQNASPPSGPSGTPAPSSSPVASPVPSDSDAVGVDGAGSFNFNSMFEPTEDGGLDDPLVTQVEVLQEPVQVAAPVVPPQQAPVEVPDAIAAAASQGPQEVSPPLSPAEPASLARAIKENEAAAIEHLASTEFALRPEEVEALENDAVSVIPKLLARAYVKAQHTMLMHLSRSVPLMIQKHLEISKRNTANSDKFYAKWTNLKAGVHGDLVNRIAQTYRGSNPKASVEQMIEDVGIMVSQLAKVAPPAPVQTSTPVSPSAGVNGSRAPQPSPFQPAMGGPVAATSQAEDSPWDILGRAE